LHLPHALASVDEKSAWEDWLSDLRGLYDDAGRRKVLTRQASLSKGVTEIQAIDQEAPPFVAAWR
jgi:hypothetical protein